MQEEEEEEEEGGEWKGAGGCLQRVELDWSRVCFVEGYTCRVRSCVVEGYIDRQKPPPAGGGTKFFEGDPLTHGS